MRFTKIKVNDKGVQLNWSTTDASGLTHSHDVSSPEKPAPELPEALSAFVPFVMDLLDLPPNWRDQIRVTTINLNEEKETKTRGLMVSVTRKIAKASGRPVSITTPHMREATENTTATTGILDDDVLELIAKAEKAAAAFVKGERMQGELIPTSQAEAPAEGEAAAGSDELAKRRGRKAGKDRKAGTPGEVWNPGSNIPPTDAQLVKICLAAGRDVPLDAVGRWTSSEREEVLRWALAAVNPDIKPNKRPEEPEILKKEATPALLEDVASEQDGWTSPTPPPKAADVKPVAVN